MSNRKRDRRFISMLLAALMLVAYIPLLGDAVYATSWSNTSTEEWGITISTDKAEYEATDDIRYNIMGFANTGKGPDTLWLGIYEYGQSDGYTKSIDWEYINADIEDNSLKADLADCEYEAGKKYHLILTTADGGNDPSGIWATLDFTVAGTPEPVEGYELEIIPEETFSEDASADNHFITWDDTYLFYKTITERNNLKVQVKVPEEMTGEKAWVGLFECDETNYSATAYDWKYVESPEEEITFDLSENDGGTSGYRKVVLFKDGGYTPAKEEMLFIRPAPGGSTEAESLVYTGNAQTPLRSQLTVLKPNGSVYRDIYWDVVFDNEESTKVGTYNYTIKFKYTVGGSIKGTYKIVDAFADPTFEWADDYSEATATFNSADPDSSAFQEVEAEVKSVTNEATCSTAGSTVYTATVSADDIDFPIVGEAPFTDTKEVEIPALGHDYDWDNAKYTWADDFSKCTATVKCKNDEEHVLTEDGKIEEEKVDPSVGEAGSVTYTATFETPEFEEQVKTKEIPAIDADDYAKAEGALDKALEAETKIVDAKDAAEDAAAAVEAYKTAAAAAEAAAQKAAETLSEEDIAKATDAVQTAKVAKADAELAISNAKAAKEAADEAVAAANEAITAAGDVGNLSEELADMVKDAKEKANAAKADADTVGASIDTAQSAKDTEDSKVTDADTKTNKAAADKDAADKKAQDEADKAAADKAAADKAAADKAAADKAAAEFAANGNAYIDPKLPKVKIKAPKKAKKSFTAKWKKLSKKQQKVVKGVEIEYSTTPDFSAAYKFKTAGKKKTSVKVKKLTSKKTYYVRAHTYVVRNGVKYVSYWSPVKKVKVK